MLDASPSQRWARSSPPKFCYANHAILSVRQAKIIFFALYYDQKNYKKESFKKEDNKKSC
ncbi:MAG: hypothetical protein A2463_01140 [Candidatus Staskawiczbacteria bacterium RIFOXYC2_FULL_32_10]|nr:MAG: hypothetical protein A2463_01140 [Candidatus Staskawiczbacteria bacterium RIFOXYC2_FULL_32_10]